MKGVLPGAGSSIHCHSTIFNAQPAFTIRAFTDSHQARGTLFHDEADRTTLRIAADSSERRREEIMVFEPFQTDRLAENQASSPIEFVVLLGAEQTFLRVIAHL
ncbi:hypothetical protein, partial [Streptomyces sp. NRRL S-475]|uniref:hypothetical protein n=1 Tax=Streptomyces sp. NRRL S-475 TaxID=1463910 RepID=UPI00131B1133